MLCFQLESADIIHEDQATASVSLQLEEAWRFRNTPINERSAHEQTHQTEKSVRHSG